MKYSIIIPVYNSVKYLAGCLDSVVGQSGDAEIILVDDGSSDGSAEVCVKYAENHDNVRVYQNKHIGAGGARNFGVSKAAGDYIIFVDSDDKLSDGFLDNFERSNVDKNADIIFFELTKAYANGRKVPMDYGLVREKLKGCDKAAVLEHMSRCNKFPVSTCGKIINRRLITDNNIQFMPECLGEDIDWSFNLIMAAETFDLFDGGTYYYTITGQSRSRVTNPKNAHDLLFIIKMWAEKIKGNEYENCFRRILAYQYAVMLPSYGSLPKVYRKELSADVRKYKYLLSFGESRKLRAIRTVISVFGTECGSRILYEYLRRRERLYGRA